MKADIRYCYFGSIGTFRSYSKERNTITQNRVTDIKSLGNLLLAINYEVQRFGHDGLFSYIQANDGSYGQSVSTLKTLQWYNYLNEKVTAWYVV